MFLYIIITLFLNPFTFYIFPRHFHSFIPLFAASQRDFFDFSSLLSIPAFLPQPWVLGYGYFFDLHSSPLYMHF